MRTLHLTLGLLCALGLAQAQDTDAARRDYESRCARCHGGNATGGESGPNITAQVAARNDTDLAAFLRQGRPASGMPAFDLPAPQMNNLIRYLRTLGDPVPRNAPPAVVRKKIQTTESRALEFYVGDYAYNLALNHVTGIGDVLAEGIAAEASNARR